MNCFGNTADEYLALAAQGAQTAKGVIDNAFTANAKPGPSAWEQALTNIARAAGGAAPAPPPQMARPAVPANTLLLAGGVAVLAFLVLR